MNDKLEGSTIIKSKTTPPLDPIDPLKHILAERTEANCNREWIKAKTSEKDFSHLEAKLADRCLTKCEASRCSKPSTDKTKGVKFPPLSSTAEQSTLFFSTVIKMKAFYSDKDESIWKILAIENQLPDIGFKT